MTGHKSDTAVESYHNRPTVEQQVQSSAIVSEFVAGSSKCQGSKEGALMDIQENHAAVPASSVSAASASTQVASASYVSHVEHSAMPIRQSFTAGQFPNCIFNINYCSH